MQDVPQIDPGTLKPWLAAVFISAIVALAGVVGYLFKQMMRAGRIKDKQISDKDAVLHNERMATAVERATFETKLEKLRAEYEAKNKEIAEEYATNIRTLYEDNRAHEDAARKEFAEIMENVQSKAEESSKAMVSMLQKFYDRFVGPRTRY